MAYIIFVNPAILEKAGMDYGAVFVATCLARLRLGHHGALRQLSDRPRAGMGLNACFAFTVVAAGIGLFLALIGLQNAGIRPGASKRSTPLLPWSPWPSCSS